MYPMFRYRVYDVYDLPDGPRSDDWWLNRIFQHRGSARDFQTRLRQAEEHVDVRECKRPMMAMPLDDAITDPRNLYLAFTALSNRSASAGPDGWTCDRFKNRLNLRLRKLSKQLRSSKYRRRRETVISI